jgi:hypothetical protein
MAVTKLETGRGFAAAGYTANSVLNTASETTLFTTTIPAGKMGDTKSLEFCIRCDLTTGALPPSITVRIKLGSATLAIMSGVSLTGSLTGKPFLITGSIDNTTNATQEVFGVVQQQAGNILGLGTTGIDMASAQWTVDTTTAQTLTVTAQFSSASSTTSLTVRNIKVELS